MGREAVTKAIDERLYEIRALPPKQAIRILTKLTKIIGAPAGAALGNAGSFAAVADASLGGDLIGKAMQAFTDRLDENEVLEIITTLLEYVMVQGPGDKGTRKILFELDFEARIGHLFKVVYAALEVNYRDFLDGFTGLVARAGAAGMSAGRLTSTGNSGG